MQHHTDAGVKIQSRLNWLYQSPKERASMIMVTSMFPSSFIVSLSSGCAGDTRHREGTAAGPPRYYSTDLTTYTHNNSAIQVKHNGRSQWTTTATCRQSAGERVVLSTLTTFQTLPHHLIAAFRLGTVVCSILSFIPGSVTYERCDDRH